MASGDRNLAPPVAITVVALAIAGVGGYVAYQQLLNNPRSVIYRPSAETEAAPPPTPQPEPASAPAPVAPKPEPRLIATRKPVPAKAALPAPTSARPALPPAAAPAAAASASVPTDLRTTEAVEVVSPEVIYSQADHDVTPPVMVNASLGNQRLTVSADRVLQIQLVVDARGDVESVYLVPDASPTLSDAMLSTFALHAIRDWRFRPAVRYGAAVRYRQTLWLRGDGEPIERPWQ